MSLSRSLAVAAGAAIIEAEGKTGTERVRLVGLARVLEAEARCARQKEGVQWNPGKRVLVELYHDSLAIPLARIRRRA